MRNIHKKTFFFIIIIFLLSISSECTAQRREGISNNKRVYPSSSIIKTESIIKTNDIIDIETDIENYQGEAGKGRSYDISLDFGFGNFSYLEHSTLGITGEQSIYTSDMFSFKAIATLSQMEGKWAIDIGGGILAIVNKLERWWTNQKLFRVNKLLAKGLFIETNMRYNFEEIALFPFQFLAQPNINTAIVYRFYGIRREKGAYLIEMDTQIPKEVDFSLFGFEPAIGFNFTMDDGTFNGYINLGTGIYGASVEKNYENKNAISNPNKTYARGILAKVGLKAEKGIIFYHFGYTLSKLKIVAKKGIPDCRINQSSLVFDFGIRF